MVSCKIFVVPYTNVHVDSSPKALLLSLFLLTPAKVYCFLLHFALVLLYMQSVHYQSSRLHITLHQLESTIA